MPNSDSDDEWDGPPIPLSMRFAIHRHYLDVYCVGCAEFVGMVHQRRSDDDYMRPNMCKCERGGLFDVDADTILDAIEYLADRGELSHWGYKYDGIERVE